MSDSVFQGLPVWSCFPGSPADRAGVKQGDIVVLANGQRIESMQAYVAARKMRKDLLELTVLRGNTMIEFNVLLQAAHSDAAVSDPQTPPRKAAPTDIT